MILAGDIGGTKCNLALVEKRGNAFVERFKSRFVSHEHARFADIIAEFVRQASDVIAASPQKAIQAAGFGVAGPVTGHSVRMTNVSWSVDRDEIQQQLATPHVVLLNDLEATGYSLPWLAADQIFTLNAGTPQPGAPQALIAAGTGLGESILHWNGSRYEVSPSEGGHCDFAPRTEREIELLRSMKKTSKAVSFEMVLSGRGFHIVHEFLDPSVEHDSFKEPDLDPAPEITRRGLDGSCPVCVETLNMWTALYGAETGNLALKALSRGGVFVAGGIVAKILPKMKDGTFFQAFCEKSKFGDLLAAMPIQIVLNEEAPMLGAAAEAARSLGI